MRGGAGPVIWDGHEERAGDLRPMPRGLNRHILLAFEMMEERALGDAGSGAKLVHRGGVIALFADHAQRHVQQADAGVPAFGRGFTTRHGRTITPGWYALKAIGRASGGERG